MTIKETTVHATSPGAVLRLARESRELSVREVADQLNWLPNWVSAIEADKYEAVRNLAFARGYVKAYGRLMLVPESELMRMFDELHPTSRGKLSAANADDAEAIPQHYVLASVVVVVIVIGIVVFLL